MELDELDIEDLIVPIITPLLIAQNILAKKLIARTIGKRPCRTGLPGKLKMEELLTCQHPTRIYEILRMQLPSFYALRDWCLGNTNLTSSRCRQSIRGVTIEEKLMIFLHIVSKGASNRDTQEEFSHSGETISR